jgi:hypothetical protein
MKNENIEHVCLKHFSLLVQKSSTAEYADFRRTRTRGRLKEVSDKENLAQVRGQ